MRNLTIDELCELFEDYAKSSFRKPTGRTTRTWLNVRDANRELRNTHLPPPEETRVGDLPADAMSARLLYLVQEQMASSGRLCRRTVNDRLGWMKHMFRWAAEPQNDLVPEDVAVKVALLRPLQHCRSSARESERVKSVSEAAVRATALFATEKLATMIWVHWHTGMRPGELVQLTRSTLDTSGGTGKPWLYRPREHKTQHKGKDRLIPLGPRAQDALLGWLAKLPPELDAIFEGTKHRRPTGKPMARLSYYRAIQRINRQHGLDDWTPNQIRHAMATRIERLAGKAAASAMLGHARESTADIYIDPNSQKAIDIAQQFG